MTESQAKELRGLLSKGDTYNVNLFTKDHVAFKQGHNAALVQLARYEDQRRMNDEGGGRVETPPLQQPRSVTALSGPANAIPDTTDTTTTITDNSTIMKRKRRPVFYLDGPDGATTRTLLQAGFCRRTELFVANEWSDTMNVLRQEHDLNQNNCYVGSAQDSLRTTFRNVPFVAAYLDGCGGDPVPIMDMIDALLAVPRAPTTLFIGFTLTAAEPSGRELLDRIQDVTRNTLRHVKEKGHYRTVLHVGDDPIRFDIDPALSRKHEGTTTCWLACTNN